MLKHPPLVLYICVSESGQHLFKKWLVAYSGPSHYINQCWNVFNWTPRNILLWNFRPNSFQENPFGHVVWKMAAILSRHNLLKPEYKLRSLSSCIQDILYSCAITHFLQNTKLTLLGWPVAVRFVLSLQIWTFWGRDRMAAISQTISWNAISWMKTFEFQIVLHLDMFLWSN